MRTYEALSLLSLFAAVVTTVVFVAFKFMGVITWTWLWTLSPLGLFLGLCALWTVVGVAFTFLSDFFEW